MISVDDEEKKSVREKIIEKQKESIGKELGLAILTLALTIGFFGSSSVLMPDQQPVTGMFSGELDVNPLVIRETSFRNEQIDRTGFSFVIDSRVENTNVVEADLEKISYEIKIEGDTVKRGVKEGSSVIPGGSEEMVAVEYGVEFTGIPDVKEVVREFERNDRRVTVEGSMDFSVAGETVSVPFIKTSGIGS